MCDTILVINRKCDPIIVNPVVKMRPQSSGTFPLASYKEVPPPGVSHDEAKDLCQQELSWRPKCTCTLNLAGISFRKKKGKKIFGGVVSGNEKLFSSA